MCLSLPPRSPKKVVETENFDEESYQICFNDYKKHLESPHLAWEAGCTCAVFDVLRHAAKRGKAQPRTFDFKTRYISMFHQFPNVRPKQL